MSKGHNAYWNIHEYPMIAENDVIFCGLKTLSLLVQFLPTDSKIPPFLLVQQPHLYLLNPIYW